MYKDVGFLIDITTGDFHWLEDGEVRPYWPAGILLDALGTNVRGTVEIYSGSNGNNPAVMRTG